MTSGKVKLLLKFFCPMLCLSKGVYTSSAVYLGKEKKTVNLLKLLQLHYYVLMTGFLRMFFCMRSSRVCYLERVRPFPYGKVSKLQLFITVGGHWSYTDSIHVDGTTLLINTFIPMAYL